MILRGRALVTVAFTFVVAACAVRPAPPSPPAATTSAAPAARCRAGALGIHIVDLPNGPRDTITDVPGVVVGHTTLRDGERLNTGVTAILPQDPSHGGNPFRDKVPAALVVQNGFRISLRTANRPWAYAKAWLYQHMSEPDGTGA